MTETDNLMIQMRSGVQAGVPNNWLNTARNHEFSLRLKFFSLRMESASYSRLSRRNEASMGRHV
jgi:hypothetical protein